MHRTPPSCISQVSKHKLAELRTEIDIAWTFLDRQIEALNAGGLSPEDAAKANGRGLGL
ncbi:MAG: hypothetical protein ACE5E8_08840 [Acidimicrobiia bacterium]